MTGLTGLERVWVNHVRDHRFPTLIDAARIVGDFEAMRREDIPTVQRFLHRRYRSLARRGYIAKRDGIWVATEKVA